MYWLFFNSISAWLSGCSPWLHDLFVCFLSYDIQIYRVLLRRNALLYIKFLNAHSTLYYCWMYATNSLCKSWGRIHTLRSERYCIHNAPLTLFADSLFLIWMKFVNFNCSMYSAWYFMIIFARTCEYSFLTL